MTMGGSSQGGFIQENGNNNNPFTTYSKQTVESEHSHKKSAHTKSIIGKGTNSNNNTPFQMQISLKQLAGENQKGITRNNKLTNGTGIHVRAKTTSDFESLSSGAKLKMI